MNNLDQRKEKRKKSNETTETEHKIHGALRPLYRPDGGPFPVCGPHWTGAGESGHPVGAALRLPLRVQTVSLQHDPLSALRTVRAAGIFHDALRSRRAVWAHRRISYGICGSGLGLRLVRRKHMALSGRAGAGAALRFCPVYDAGHVLVHDPDAGGSVAGSAGVCAAFSAGGCAENGLCRSAESAAAKGPARSSSTV